MKNYGTVSEPKDIATKEYVDNSLPKDFELIEEINLTADTGVITRETEPNGTDYNFSALFAIVNFPAKTEDYDIVGVAMKLYGEDNKDIFQEKILINNQQLTQWASHNWLPIGVLNIKGIQIPYIGKITSNRYYGVPATLLPYTVFNRIIKRVALEEMSSTNKQFIAGTKISIYGVRA